MSQWLRLKELGTTEQRAKSLGCLFTVLLKFGSTLYTSVIVKEGLFGWEVGLRDWKNED